MTEGVSAPDVDTLLELEAAVKTRRYYYDRLKTTESLALDMAEEFEWLFEELEAIAPGGVIHNLQGELMSLRRLAHKIKEQASQPDEAQAR